MTILETHILDLCTIIRKKWVLADLMYGLNGMKWDGLWNLSPKKHIPVVRQTLIYFVFWL